MSDKIKNCNKCRFDVVGGCDIINEDEKFKKFKKEDKSDRCFDLSVGEIEFKDNYCCDEFVSEGIEFPINVESIEIVNSKLKDSREGSFIAIRPCGEEYQNKTYLGVYLGRINTDVTYMYNTKTHKMEIHSIDSPAIFVYDLNKIIYGYESFWRVIKTKEDLKDISNDDINNVWYVKAIQSISN